MHGITFSDNFNFLVTGILIFKALSFFKWKTHQFLFYLSCQTFTVIFEMFFFLWNIQGDYAINSYVNWWKLLVLPGQTLLLWNILTKINLFIRGFLSKHSLKIRTSSKLLIHLSCLLSFCFYSKFRFTILISGRHFRMFWESTFVGFFFQQSYRSVAWNFFKVKAAARIIFNYFCKTFQGTFLQETLGELFLIFRNLDIQAFNPKQICSFDQYCRDTKFNKQKRRFFFFFWSIKLEKHIDITERIILEVSRTSILQLSYYENTF